MTELAALRVLDSFSDRGDGPVNEDVFQYGQSAAWVVDGATALTEPFRIEGMTSPRWLAEVLSQFLANYEPNVHSWEQLGRARLHSAAAQGLNSVHRDTWRQWPSASLGFAVASAERLIVDCIGDVEVVLLLRTGRYASLRVADSRSPLVSYSKVTGAAALIKQRNEVLGEESAWTISRMPPHEAAWARWEGSREDVCRALLFSDGFGRIRRYYGSVPIHSILQGRLAIQDAVKDLRIAEASQKGDHSEKTHDDATAVLISLEAGCV